VETIVSCQDIAERPRMMIVRGDHGRIVLVNPPGCGAYLSDEQADELVRAIHLARVGIAAAA
jgi:hypothetical protein